MRHDLTLKGHVDASRRTLRSAVGHWKNGSAHTLSAPAGMVVLVTETEASETVISEALAVIDQALLSMQHRSLVSTDEVSNLLLDLRLLLVAAAPIRVEDLQVPTGV